MVRSIYNTAGYDKIDPRMTDYHAAITRDRPFWTATVTGGTIPEPGHVITSMSYVRLCAEVQDWLEWHYEREPAPPVDDLDSADDGEGFRICYDYSFPEAVGDAQDRYWQTQRQLAKSRMTVRQAVWDIRDGLRASAEDIACLLLMSPEEAQQILDQRDLGAEYTSSRPS